MRFVLAVALVLLVAPAFAGVIDLGVTKMDLPEAKTGAIISLKEQGVEATVSTTLLGYDTKIGRFELDVGGAPAINEPIVALAYHVGDLEKLGFYCPLNKYLDLSVGVYAGYEINSYNNNPNDKWNDALDYGIYCSILRIAL